MAQEIRQWTDKRPGVCTFQHALKAYLWQLPGGDGVRQRPELCHDARRPVLVTPRRQPRQRRALPAAWPPAAALAGRAASEARSTRHGNMAVGRRLGVLLLRRPVIDNHRR